MIFYKKNRLSHSLTSVLVVVFVVMILVASVVWMMRPTTLPIKQVHIEGEFLWLDTNRLQELVTEKVDGGFFNTDIAAIRNALLMLPWVHDVSVHRVWPDGLRVVVQENTALVRWNGTGLLNEQGQYFSLEKHSIPQHLPLLEGAKESRALLLKRFRLLKQTYGLSVVHLYLDARRAWGFELENGLIVVLGRTDFEDRMERFVRVVINNLGEKLSQAMEIDMRYTNGFAVRWKQHITISVEHGVH